MAEKQEEGGSPTNPALNIHHPTWFVQGLTCMALLRGSPPVCFLGTCTPFFIHFPRFPCVSPRCLPHQRPSLDCDGRTSCCLLLFPNNFQHRQTFVPSFLFVSASERPPIQGSSQAEVNLRFHPFFLGLDSFPGHFPTLLWGSATMTVRSKPAPNNPHFLGRNFKMFLAPLDARGDIVTLFAFFF